MRWLDWLDLRSWWPRRTITAAAPTPSAKPRTSPVEGRNLPAWQRDAWRQYDLCGELRFAARWVGRSVAKARLYAAVIQTPDEQPEPLAADHPAQQLVTELYGGRVGQTRMLKLMATQVFVAGDTNLIIWDQDGERHWEVRSPREINASGDGKTTIKINSVEGPKDFTLPANALIVPIRETHPDKATEPDSSVRAVIASLVQIEWATNMITSLTRSRLAVAGLLLMSQKLDFPGRPGVLDPATGRMIKNTETFWDSLIDAAQDWIENPLDPSATVPAIVAGPADDIKATTLVEFATKVLDKLIQVRDSAIRRLSLGLDLPPEVVTGIGESSNHWNAWMISDEGIKTSVEPVLDTLCDGLTQGWIRPALKALQYEGEDLDRIVIWRDLSDLTTRPNKEQAVTEAYDRLEVSGEYYRDQHGIPEDAKPDEQEKATRLLVQLVQKINPDVGTAAELLRKLGITVSGTPAASAPQIPATQRSQTPPAPPVQPGQPQTGEDTPRQAPNNGHPPRETVVAHAMVAHALKYAGARYMKGLGRSVHRLGVEPETLYLHRPVPVEAIAGLLKGCWEGTWSVLPDELIASVDAHVRDLLRSARPYDPDHPPCAGGRP